MSFSLHPENLSKVELKDDRLICMTIQISKQDFVTGVKKADIIVKEISKLKSRFLPTLRKVS